MQLDRFTTKSQEAIQAASGLAAGRNTEVQPEHLLAVLLEQNDGVIPPVLRKIGTSPEEIRRVVNAALDGSRRSPPAPRSPPTPASCSTSCASAEREAGKLRDEYISTEHLLIALSEAPGAAGQALPQDRRAARRRRGRSAARTASPRRTPRTPSRRSRSSAATSPRRPRRAGSTR